MAKAGVKEVKEFFGMGLAEMKAEWINGGLTDKDKNDILTGLGDGSLNY